MIEKITAVVAEAGQSECGKAFRFVRNVRRCTTSLYVFPTPHTTCGVREYVNTFRTPVARTGGAADG